MSFVENKGQWASNIAYQSPLNFGFIYFEKDNFTFILEENELHHHAESSHEDMAIEQKGHHFKIKFIDANKNVQFFEEDKSAHYNNYFIGKDQTKWASYVYEYKSITYQNLYSGIDMKVMGQADNMKYEYYVAPHQDPKQIKVAYDGVEELHIENGNLIYKTSLAEIKELKPIVYQLIGDKKVIIEANYKLNKKKNLVQFEFPNGYDESLELIIDPTLIFSRLTESTSSNFGFTATYDDLGRAYGAGIVFGASGTYPTSTGAYDNTFNGGTIDMGITCYHQNSGAIIYSTYLGGSATDLPNSMIVNQADELLILGTTSSSDFPIADTSTAFNSTFNGGFSANFANNGVNLSNGSDIVLAKLNNAGSSLLASTFVGGSSNDGVNDDLTIQGNYVNNDLHYNYGDAFRGEVIVDENDNIYVASSTNSLDFPMEGDTSFLQGEQDAVVFKMTSQLDSMLFSRYLGGTNDDGGYSMKIDSDSSLFVVGGTISTDFPSFMDTALNTYNGGISDGFVSKLNSTNGSILVSTYIGTASYDQVFLIDIDMQDNIYIVGQTLGNYININAAYGTPNTKHFIQKMDNDLANVIYSTTFGNNTTSVEISPTAILVDICERVYVSGWGGTTNSFRNSSIDGNISGLPVTIDAIQSSTNGSGDFYFFILDKNAAGLEYASYFGGTASEHVDGGTSRFDDDGIIYQAVCAACSGGNFIVSPGYSSTASTQCNLGLIKLNLDLPSTSVTVDASPRATGCAPLIVNFTATLENVNSFFWDFGDGGATSTLQNPTHSYNNVGTYQVALVGVDSQSCNLSDTAYLEVFVDDDTLNAQFVDELIIDCEQNTVIVKSNNYSTTEYFWDMGDGNTYTTDSVHHQYATPGTYEITLHLSDSTSCELEDSASLSIEILPMLDASFTLSDSFGCIPFDISFTNQSNIAVDSILWFFGDGTSSTNNNPTHSYNMVNTYQVQLIVYDTNTCNVADTAIAEIRTDDERVLADFEYIILNECDSLLQIELDNTSINADSYTWYFDGVDVQTVEEPGVYDFIGVGVHQIVLVAQNDSLCNPKDSVLANFELLPNIVADFRIEPNCEKEKLFIENLTNAGQEFEWDFGNGDSSMEKNPIYTYTQSGSYVISLSVIDSNTCNILSTHTENINIIDEVIADFTTDSSIYLYPDPTIFTNLSINYTEFLWNFGDGESDSLEENPIHYYTKLGAIQACLEVANEYCKDTICDEVFIDFEANIGVPNAFSPNGDGINDVITVEGVGIELLVFKIYNRWGELIFESNDQNIGWDGKYKAVSQEQEVYTYVVEAVFINKQTAVLKGNITLLR